MKQSTMPSPGNDILGDIVATKRRDLPAILSQRAERPAATRISFREAIRHQPCGAIIAELKRRSPSRGILCEEYDPAQIAAEYREGGAAALSVLTDGPYFGGDIEHLALAKRASGLPALCKDFFIDPRQVFWAAEHGADAALLIARILDDGALAEMLEAVASAGLDALVETHTRAEIERACKAGAQIIGVNCRDLKSFGVALDLSVELGSAIPASVTAVAESGVRSAGDIERLRGAGYQAFLIGEALMTAPNRVRALETLRGGC